MDGVTRLTGGPEGTMDIAQKLEQIRWRRVKNNEMKTLMANKEHGMGEEKKV